MSHVASLKPLDIARMDVVGFVRAFHGGAVPVPDGSIAPRILPRVPYRRGVNRHAGLVPLAPGYLVVVGNDGGVTAFARTFEGVGDVVARADPELGLVMARGTPPVVADEVVLRHLEHVAPIDREIVKVGYDEIFRLVDVHRRAVTSALQIGHPLPAEVLQVYHANGETAALAVTVLQMNGQEPEVTMTRALEPGL